MSALCQLLSQRRVLYLPQTGLDAQSRPMILTKYQDGVNGRKEFLREFLSHLSVTILYLSTISLLVRNLSLSFWLGGLLGMNLLDIDHLLYVFTHSREEACLPVFVKWHERKYKEAILYFAGSHKSYNRKLLHNGFFAVIFAIFSALVLATSDSLFLVGLTLSIYLHLLKDIIADLRDIEHLKHWLFWPVNSSIRNYVVKIYVATLSLVFLLLTNTAFRKILL